MRLQDYFARYSQYITAGCYDLSNMKLLSPRLTSLLRWSERYTKTDMVYLASGGLWLGIAQIAASLVGFLSTVAFANLLTQETLGEYRFFLSAVLILSVFALPGMRSALLESTPKGFRGNLLVAYSAMMRWAVAGSIIAVAASMYYLWQESYALAIGFGIIAVLLPLLDASAVHLEYLKALREFKRVALYTLITRSILLILSIIVALLYPDYAWAVLAAFLLGSIVPNLLFHTKTRRRFIKASDISDPGLMPYAKHLSLMAVLGLVALQLDKVFVWHFLGAQELALFFIAYAIPQEAARFLQIVPTLAFPKFAVSTPETIRRTLMPKMLVQLGITTALVGTYILLAPFIFSMLFPQYMAAVPYSQVLILTALASAFLPISTYFAAQKAVRTLYFLSVFLPSVRIASLVILIAAFGLWGAVYALLLEALVSAICWIVLFVRMPKVPQTI